MSGGGFTASRSLTRLVVAVSLATALALGTQAVPVSAQPQPLNVAGEGDNGVGRISRPGRTCAEGGDGASWHYAYRSALAPGSFSNLPGELRLNLDLHSEAAGAPQASYSRAWLLGDESAATLANDRGTLRLVLRAGDGCPAEASNPADAPLAFDGSKVSGTGSWTVAGATGSYRGAVGSGTFALTSTGVEPGADNHFGVKLDGTLDVRQPNLRIAQVDSYWGFLGADYLLRQVTVVYRVTNLADEDPATLEGDAFDVRLQSVATGADSGVTVLGPTVQRLGDLAPGQSEDIRVRYELGIEPDKPCDLVILGCEFKPDLRLTRLDALDVGAEHQQTVPSAAPLFPPPL